MSLYAPSTCHSPCHEIVKPESNIHDQTKPNAAWSSKWYTHRVTIPFIERQNKAHRLHEKRSVSQQGTAFDQGLTHESEVKFRQVANTTMHELGSFATCASDTFNFVNKRGPVNTSNTFQGKSCTRDAPTDSI